MTDLRKRAAKKYQSVKPGLYFQGTILGGSFSLGLIYVISAKYEDKTNKITQNEWKGIVYKYFSFGENKIYTFNEYWTDFIDALKPVADKSVVQRAKEIIQEQASIFKEEKNKVLADFNIISSVK